MAQLVKIWCAQWRNIVGWNQFNRFDCWARNKSEFPNSYGAFTSKLQKLVAPWGSICDTPLRDLFFYFHFFDIAFYYTCTNRTSQLPVRNWLQIHCTALLSWWSGPRTNEKGWSSQDHASCSALHPLAIDGLWQTNHNFTKKYVWVHLKFRVVSRGQDNVCLFALPPISLSLMM